MHQATAQAFVDELEKIALLERLVRLGATDIPGTPRLLMKHRDPHALKALQQGVEQAWNKKVTDPLMGVAEKGIKHLPEEATVFGRKLKPQLYARKAAKLVAEDPVGTLAANLVPLPGAHPAYLGGKKALEYGIDKLAPLPA